MGTAAPVDVGDEGERMAVAARRVGAKTRQRIQHYALTEPSFTIPFAAWELDLSDTCVRHVVMDMLRAGRIEQIEERDRRYNLSAVYQAKRRESTTLRVATITTPRRELTDRKLAWTTEEPA
jgi:hypothetical protein